MTAVPIEKRAVSKARRQKVIAAQQGVCKRAHCEAPATDADHIIPLWAGGSNRDENLEGLCGPCHLQKTKAEAKARAKAKRIAARIDGTRRERQPIPQRANPWTTGQKLQSGGFGGGPSKRALRVVARMAGDDPTACPSHGGYGCAADVNHENPAPRSLRMGGE